MAQSLLRTLLRKTLTTFLLPLSSTSPSPLSPFKPYNRPPFPFSHSHTHFSSAATNLNQEHLNPKKKKKQIKNQSHVDFTKIDPTLLPTVIIVGRPNVGKSALFNRFIRRREALVYNTPDDHVTRDFREGIAKLGELRFRVLDSAGLETEATSGTILSRTTAMTANVLARAQFAIFLVDVRCVGNLE